MTEKRNINDAILDGSIRHLAGIERLQNGLKKELIDTLNDYDPLIVGLFASWASTIFDSSLTMVQREAAVRAFKQDMSKLNKEAYDKVLKKAVDSLGDAALYEAAFQTRLITSAAKNFDAPQVVARFDGSLSSIVTSRIVENHPVRGLPAPEWVKEMQRSRLTGIVGAMREGLTDGLTIDQAVTALRGTKSAKFKDGALNKYRNSLATFARTALLAVATRTRDELGRRNAELFDGVQWNSILDSRTSPVCISRDGKIYPIDSGPRPPAHYNCRSTTSLVIAGERPANDIDYPQWLAKQPTEVVEEVLGKTRAALYKKGDLPIEKMFSRDDKLILLDELKKVEANAFDKAGLGR